MHGLTECRWFQERCRMADRPAVSMRAEGSPPANVSPASPGALAGVGPTSLDGRCCQGQELQLEPCYPYSADWRPRCRGCGRWHAADAGREPILVFAAAAERPGALPLPA